MEQLKLIPCQKPSINQSDIDVVIKSLKTFGKKNFIEKLESEFAKLCKAKFSVSFNSKISAFQAMFYAINLNQFDRVITSPNNYIDSITAVIQNKATPVFVDIESNSGNMSIPQTVATLKHLSRGRDVIMPSHFAGIPFNMRSLENKIKDPNVIIIEDATQGGVYSHNFSNMTIFDLNSFSDTSGGIVTTNDENLYKRLLAYRSNLGTFSIEHCEKVCEKSGLTLNNIQAALALNQLKRLSHKIKAQNQLIAQYKEYLLNIKKIKLLLKKTDQHINYTFFPVIISYKKKYKEKKELISRLLEKNIETQIQHYPLYRLFKGTPRSLEDFFPNTEKFYNKMLSLPFHEKLKKEDIERICLTLKELVE